MTSLEDKILGEKKEYYCSSSEDEAEEKITATKTETDIPKWEGTATNTGPKGVIKDFQRYKQLEAEKNAEKEKERLELLKKLSMTCKSKLDEAEEDKDEDGFLMEYMQQRMSEMLKKTALLPKFGSVINIIDADQFLHEVDNEHKDVTIVVHIYQDDITGCDAMNGCLSFLSKEYNNIKFCKFKCSAAGVSHNFSVNGIPALLVYKGGQLVGNFIRLTDEFGDDFFANDVENFLIEHGMIPDKTCVPQIIKSSKMNENESLED